MSYNGPLPQAIKAGGTAVSSVTIAPTSTAFAGWDANKNLSAFNLLEGYTTTATSGITTTLTVGSTGQQFFTGTTTQTVHLPVASTLALGQAYYVVNNSTGVVTVESSGGNTVKAMAASTWAIYTCILTSGTTAASWNVEYGQSSGGIETISGDSGSITGSTVTIYADNASTNCGQTVQFVNSGTASTLNVTDARENTLIGLNSGSTSGTSAVQCTGLGFIALNSITTDSYCTAVGAFCLDNVAGSTSNTGLGYNVGSSLTGGNYNTLLGANAGQNYSANESSNVMIGNSGTASESNVLRIGSGTGTGNQQLSTAFISGINGNTVSSAMMVTIDSSTDQLGTATIPVGTIWNDEGVNFNAVAGNGYNITSSVTATLPSTAVLGDTISFMVDVSGASNLVIQAAGGYAIRMGSTVTPANGTATNTAQGDSVTLVFSDFTNTWISLNQNGSWILS
jgi:hypothetical protein